MDIIDLANLIIDKLKTPEAIQAFLEALDSAPDELYDVVSSAYEQKMPEAAALFFKDGPY